MESAFKELNLDRTRIEKCINEFCQQKNIEEPSFAKLNNSKNVYRVQYSDTENKVVVDFYYNKNGTTTISPTGKNTEKGLELAEFVKGQLLTDERRNIAVSVKNIDQSCFDLLNEFLVESRDEEEQKEFECTEKLNDPQQQKQIWVKSLRHQDSLTINFYKNRNTILIQGKPLYVYSKVSYFLSEQLDYNGFLEIVSKGDENAASSARIIGEDSEEIVRQKLGDSFDCLGEILIKMLETSYKFRLSQIELPDYSCCVYPALRALEGVIKKILLEHGIICLENQNQSFSFQGIFDRDPVIKNRYTLHKDFEVNISSQQIRNKLSNCYTYYHRQRHSLFHAEIITDSTRLIENKRNADEITDKVFELISDLYSTLK
ncbi:MAG: hypothetical protein HC890_05540 [Chloroflexaceae bacterium]|nr:hypothetical protein [Chloroflexaceae bacterium]